MDGDKFLASRVVQQIAYILASTRAPQAMSRRATAHTSFDHVAHAGGQTWCTARATVTVSIMIVVLAFSGSSACAFVNNARHSAGFLKPQIVTFRRHHSSVLFRQYSGDNPPESEDLPDQSDDGSLNNEVKRRAETIKLEKERERLEEENFLKRLKSKPRKLPYEQARTWVQANLGVDTPEEFYDLVENGNLRTPYIPKNPQEYYTKTRDWISWDHFLCGIFDNKTPSSIRPQTGIFD